MKKTKRLLRFTLSAGICAALLALASCFPEFVNPLPPPPGGKFDTPPAGLWQGVDEKNKDDDSQLLILPRDSGWLDVIFVSDIGNTNGVGVIPFEGYVTAVGKDKFLCVRAREQDSEDSKSPPETTKFWIFRCETKRRRLSLTPCSQEKIGTLIEQNKLAGTTTNTDYTSTSTVTASSEELAALVAAQGPRVLLADDALLRFRRKAR